MTELLAFIERHQWGSFFVFVILCGTLVACVEAVARGRFAEVPGTPEHARELCQVAAVYVRGLLVTMGTEVPS